MDVVHWRAYSNYVQVQKLQQQHNNKLYQTDF